eukprot:6769953-Lingulodinium_polyedra.AAC.1
MAALTKILVEKSGHTWCGCRPAGRCHTGSKMPQQVPVLQGLGGGSAHIGPDVAVAPRAIATPGVRPPRATAV